MKINNIIELEDGKKVQFLGEMEGTELEYVLQTGINFLFFNGLLATVKAQTEGEVPPEGELH